MLQAVELRLAWKNIHSTVDNLPQENSAEGKIKAILTVDAISLTPEIYVSNNLNSVFLLWRVKLRFF